MLCCSCVNDMLIVDWIKCRHWSGVAVLSAAVWVGAGPYVESLRHREHYTPPVIVHLFRDALNLAAVFFSFLFFWLSVFLCLLEAILIESEILLPQQHQQDIGIFFCSSLSRNTFWMVVFSQKTPKGRAECWESHESQTIQSQRLPSVEGPHSCYDQLHSRQAAP